MIISVFVISRVALLMTSLIAQRIVPYLGFFPYKELLVEFNLPSWISSLANFDGIHYLQIAKQGYSQWEQAFFPFYPLTIRFVALLIPNFLISSLLVSNVSFGAGIIFLQKLLTSLKINASWIFLMMLSFPTAFFFGISYTEGLFFLLFVLSLYFLIKKNYWLAGIFAALSSATRLIGIFLVIPFFFHLVSRDGISMRNIRFIVRRHAFLILSPLLGLFSYMAYLWASTGDPLFFFNSQPVFGANRSTHLIFLPQVYYRYLKIAFIANHDFQWCLSLFEMGMFSFVFIVLILDLIMLIRGLSSPSAHLRGVQRTTTSTYFRLGLNIFSCVNLVLPTLTGTFSSIPRYALFSISLFIFLAQLKSGVVKVGIVLVFITLQILLLSLFVQGYFIG